MISIKTLRAIWAVLLVGCATAGALDLTTNEQAEIRAAAQNTLVHIPELARRRGMPVTIPAIPLDIASAPGAQLLFSDMPEYLGASNGISMLEEVTNGNYRLYVYHVPGEKGVGRTVTAVIKNLGEAPLHVQFDRATFVPAGNAYAAMGVYGLVQFFSGTNLPTNLTVAPGDCERLSERLDQTAACDPQLVHAIFEFKIDQPARIAVLQRDNSQNSSAALETLPRLPRQWPGRHLSGAGRGLFPIADFSVKTRDDRVIDTTNGVQRLLLADGRTNPWILGTDQLSGNTPATNSGNYGVIYHIRLPFRSSDGRAFALLVGAADRGAPPMAALQVSAGIWRAGWQAVDGPRPANRQRGLATVVQEFPAPPKGAVNYMEITYSPPGGSSLPTPIFLAPYRP